MQQLVTLVLNVLWNNWILKETVFLIDKCWRKLNEIFSFKFFLYLFGLGKMTTKGFRFYQQEDFFSLKCSNDVRKRYQTISTLNVSFGE